MIFFMSYCIITIQFYKPSASKPSASKSSNILPDLPNFQLKLSTSRFKMASHTPTTPTYQPESSFRSISFTGLPTRTPHPSPSQTTDANAAPLSFTRLPTRRRTRSPSPDYRRERRTLTSPDYRRERRTRSPSPDYRHDRRTRSPSPDYRHDRRAASRSHGPTAEQLAPVQYTFLVGLHHLSLAAAGKTSTTYVSAMKIWSPTCQPQRTATGQPSSSLADRSLPSSSSSATARLLVLMQQCELSSRV